jgi:hypothetical protein
MPQPLIEWVQTFGGHPQTTTARPDIWDAKLYIEIFGASGL